MNTAKIVSISKPLIDGITTAEEFIAYAARVSNPGNQMNTLTADRLLKYCFNNKHFSIFEMVNVVMQIDTTRDIARQVLRHRSFSFQEFSQRYADPTKELGFVSREARLQDTKNRQNSIKLENDSAVHTAWNEIQENVSKVALDAYNSAISLGIAKEQARAVLPEGITASRLYMNGTLRSWIHWIELRTDSYVDKNGELVYGTQKEHVDLALSAKNELLRHFPFLNVVWGDK